MPLLLETYPDARVILLHRDPVKALASVADVVGTLFWMRTDAPFAGDSFGMHLQADRVARNLERVIGWLEDGTLPRERVCNVRYRDFATKPEAAIERIYADFDVPASRSRAEDRGGPFRREGVFPEWKDSSSFSSTGSE